MTNLKAYLWPVTVGIFATATTGIFLLSVAILLFVWSQ